jgi:site-specific DNA-methyltransferase (cytosine-N4-specific)
VSNQESDTRYAAVKKSVSRSEVFTGFNRAVRRIVAALQDRNYPLESATVLEADTLELAPSRIGRKVGIVITSPPYPNAYEYWLYHKYRMWWLGHDPIAVKAKEIGARAHFFKARHHTAHDFERQMAKTFTMLSAVTASGGYACLVVGRSKIHGAIVDNAKIVEEAAAQNGFTRLFSVERLLSPTRKSFNLAHANIKTETVLVFQLG